MIIKLLNWENDITEYIYLRKNILNDETVVVLENYYGNKYKLYINSALWFQYEEISIEKTFKIADEFLTKIGFKFAKNDLKVLK